jgi:hypothetical protein
MGFMMGGPMGALAGGVIGGGVGLMGGLGQKSAERSQRAALAAQERAQRAEMARRNAGVALAQQQFGDVWSMGDTPTFREWGGTGGGTGGGAIRGAAIGAGVGGAVSMGMGASIGASLGASMGGKKKASQAYGNNQADIDAFRARQSATIARHGQLAGGIESNATAVRDAGAAQLTGAGQQAAVAQRGASLDRGLMGSSLDESARKALLGQFVAGRSNVAQAAESARQGGWDALKSGQNQFEAIARGGSDITGQMRGISTANQLAGARAQMPYALFGNLLSSGMGVFGAGARSEAAGGAGFSALGLPKLGLGATGNKPIGASVSKGV